MVCNCRRQRWSHRLCKVNTMTIKDLIDILTPYSLNSEIWVCQISDKETHLFVHDEITCKTYSHQVPDLYEDR